MALEERCLVDSAVVFLWTHHIAYTDHASSTRAMPQDLQMDADQQVL